MTSYSVPVVEQVREVLAIKPNFDTPYWNTIRRLTELSLQRGRGRWITGVTDLHTNGDLLAALRNPQDLCTDCADDLEGVRLACQYVTDWFAPISTTSTGGLRRPASPAPLGRRRWRRPLGTRSLATSSA